MAKHKQSVSIAYKLIRAIALIVTAVMLFTCSASAKDYGDIVHSYDGYLSLPASEKTEVLKCVDWNGKTKLKDNTCYFVCKNTTLTKSFTLPESSMLVIRNNARLVIGKNGKLYSKGVIIIHTDGSLNVRYGSLCLKASSVTAANGKLSVSKGGKASLYGYAEFSSSGAVSINGKLSVLNNGKLAVKNEPKVLSSGVLKGTPELLAPEAKMMYFFDELYLRANEVLKLDYNNIGRVCVLQDETTVIKKLLDNFESVIYKYSGDVYLLPNDDEQEFYGFDLPTHMNLRFLDVTDSYKRLPRVTTGISYWNGIARYDAYYCVYKGRADQSLFREVLEEYGEDY